MLIILKFPESIAGRVFETPALNELFCNKGMLLISNFDEASRGLSFVNVSLSAMLIRC